MTASATAISAYSVVRFFVPAKSISLVPGYTKIAPAKRLLLVHCAVMRSVLDVSDMAFVGGHAALDFVNTAEERGDPEADDALRSAADLRAWGQRYGLIARGRARAGAPDAGDAAEFELAREARELLYALFFAR